MMFFTLNLVVLLGIGTTALAGVYPNYRANYEFIPLDVEKAAAGSDYKKWWQTAAFYQIYPRSFKDSDGDGVGDLNGITANLAYLKEIGITATWLSPIFKSPMADFGYDIANFTAIDPIFGTMEDFDALMEKSRSIGVKIILDFVPNHSSDECLWFKKSIARDPEYKDFYVWHPGKIVNGTRYPPNNWVSVFRGPAWTWNDERQEYYLHQFVYKQPDLNYRNPKVHEAMKEVLIFWLKKGIAGFRIDAVPHVYEVAPDAQGNYPDEPRQGSNNDPDDYGYVEHIYTTNQPETIDLVYEWRSILDQFQKENGGDDRVILAEAYTSVDVIMKYYGNGTVEGAQIPFNFFMISWLTNESDAYHYAETINTWLSNMPAGRTANWVIGNHDKNRVGSRLGRDRIDMLNMLVLSLPGCSITYNGEEIGMTDVWISWNDTVDPQACNSNPSVYEHMSRDPERTPFQWNDGKNAGFTTGEKTWLPVSTEYTRVNLKRQRGITRSHINIYKEMQNLRREETLRNGDAEVKAVSNTVLAVKRALLNNYVYITLMNLMDNIETVNLHATFSELPPKLEYVTVNNFSPRRSGDTAFTDLITLMPKEAVVLRSITKLTTTVGYFTYFANNNKEQIAKNQ